MELTAFLHIGWRLEQLKERGHLWSEGNSEGPRAPDLLLWFWALSAISESREPFMPVDLQAAAGARSTCWCVELETPQGSATTLPHPEFGEESCVLRAPAPGV